jgi:hypothetical protein
MRLFRRLSVVVALAALAAFGGGTAVAADAALPCASIPGDGAWHWCNGSIGANSTQVSIAADVPAGAPFQVRLVVGGGPTIWGGWSAGSQYYWPTLFNTPSYGCIYTRVQVKQSTGATRNYSGYWRNASC